MRELSKNLLFIFLFATSSLPSLKAQSDLSMKLSGTWKVEGKETFESWQVLSEGSLKGISYRQGDVGVDVMEYLELSFHKGSWTYKAQVIDQNEGDVVHFKQISVDSGWCFENKKHDFPQRICYYFLSDAKLFIKLEGSNREAIMINLTKVKRAEHTTTSGSNPNYDEALAKQLGADDYGMKPYMLVMLKSGENDTISSEARQELFRGHMDNIGRLVEEGELIVAGPLGPNQWGYRGIFILDVADLAEAEIILQSDPAISAGLLATDLFPWYGSAALPEYLPASDKVWRKQP